jgi:hypothetical protein
VLRVSVYVLFSFIYCNGLYVNVYVLYLLINDKHVFIENLRAYFGMGAVRYQGSHTLYMVVKNTCMQFDFCKHTQIHVARYKIPGAVNI